MEADKFAERIMEELTATNGLLHIYIGHKLKLWNTITEFPSNTCSPAQLAAKAGIAPRYALEWLRGCAAFGYMQYQGLSKSNEDSKAVANTGSSSSQQGSTQSTSASAEVDPKYHELFTLPAQHAVVLTDPLSPAYMVALPSVIPAVCGALPKLLDAFKTGQGVSYKTYGPDMVEAIGETNHPVFHNELESWLAKVPDVFERLKSAQENSVRIVDLGCGKGYSSVKLAQIFPNSTVEAVDLDEASIRAAREYAKQVNLENRVKFHCSMADQVNIPNGSVDMVTMFECLHDISNPVQVLQKARHWLRPETGVLMVADMRNEDRFEDMMCNHQPDSQPKSKPSQSQGQGQNYQGHQPHMPLFSENPKCFLSRFNCGVSTLHCLPASLAIPNSVGLGTCGVTPASMKAMALEAGFKSCETILEAFLWRLYRLQV